MSEFFAALLVSSTPFAVTVAWYRRVCAATPPALALAGAMIVAATVQAGIGLALGVAGALTPVGVSIAYAGVTVVALMVAVRAERGTTVTDGVDGVQWIGAGLLLAVGGTITWLSLVQPAANFDSLAYHLPMLAHWVQTAGLGDLEHLGIHRHYAYGFEVWSLPLAVVLRSDVAAALPNVAGWALLAIGVCALAHQAGVRSVVAMPTAIVVAMAPVTLGRLDAIQPDLWTGALFVVAVSAIVHALRTHERSSAVVAVLALGLLPFLKASGWAYAGVLVLGVVGLVVIEGARARLVSLLRARDTGVAVLVALVLASFWYVRNLMWTGNPLGDFEVQVAGITIFEGPIPASELRRTSVAGVFRFADAGDWVTLRFMSVTMLGWTVIAWAGGGLLVASTRIRFGRPRPLPLLLLALFLLCLLVYVHLPYGGDNGDRGYRLTPWSAAAMRYAVPAWALLGVLGAVGLSQRAWGAVLAGIAAIVALERGCTQILGLRLTDALALTLLVLLVASSSWFVARTLASRTIVLLLFLGLVAAIIVARPQREAAWEGLYGPFFAEVERVVPDDAPIAYYVLTRPYPLVGKRMEHPLTSRPDPWSDRELQRADPELWETEVRRWLDTLGRDGIRHLVVLTHNRFAERDGRGSAAHALLQREPQWRMRIAPEAPVHLALWVWQEGDPPGSSSP